MKKSAYRHLSIVLSFLMMFTFVPVFGDSIPAGAGGAEKALVQSLDDQEFKVEAQHFRPNHWFKKSQPAPKGLDAIAPTSEGGKDGKIIGTNRAMEYKMVTERKFKPVKGHEIRGLAAGTYQVRYAARPGYWPSPVVTGDVPPYVPADDDQEAPIGLKAVAPTSADNDDGKITGTTTEMEYMMEGDESWIPAPDVEITGLIPGVYHVRCAATDSEKASEHVVLTISAYEDDKPDQEAPIGLAVVAPTSADNDDGKITGTTTEMEYMMEGDESWIPAPDVEITGLIPGVYHVRCAATASEDPGQHVILTIPVFEDEDQDQPAPTGLEAVAPTSEDNNDGKILGTTEAMEIKFHGEETWMKAMEPETTDLIPGVYHVRFAAKEGYNAGAEVMITVPDFADENQDQPAPTGLVPVAPTSSANDDGKITGTTTAMEYQLHTDSAYTPVTGTEITGLEPGMYHVRYAAKEGYNASPHAMVTVPAFEGNEDQEAPTGLEAVAPTTEDNDDGMITGTTEEMEFMMEGDTEWTPATEPEITGLEPGDYHVRYAAAEGLNASEHVVVTVPAFEANEEQEAPTGLEALAPTTEENDDGTITGTTEDMEFMLEGAAEWTPATDTELYGLVPGTYHVRFAEREGFNASPYTVVIVPAFEEADEF